MLLPLGYETQLQPGKMYLLLSHLSSLCIYVLLLYLSPELMNFNEYMIFCLPVSEIDKLFIYVYLLSLSASDREKLCCLYTSLHHKYHPCFVHPNHSSVHLQTHLHQFIYIHILPPVSVVSSSVLPSHLSLYLVPTVLLSQVLHSNFLQQYLSFNFNSLFSIYQSIYPINDSKLTQRLACIT